MTKRIVAIILLTIFILSAFSSCRKPDNSANGGALIPGTVTLVK